MAIKINRKPPVKPTPGDSVKTKSLVRVAPGLNPKDQRAHIESKYLESYGKAAGSAVRGNRNATPGKRNTPSEDALLRTGASPEFKKLTQPYMDSLDRATIDKRRGLKINKK